MFFNSIRSGLYVLLLAAGTLTLSKGTQAENSPYSPFLTGPLGLNTIPSARMDEPGTVKFGVATLDPYIHTFAGMQIAPSLYINLRQTAEISNIRESADRLYPGMDFKLRLAREGPHTPEISLGIQSALGHKRMAGEYLALSKRWSDFDFTAGLGWGRFGSAGNVPNPLRALGGHFSTKRNLDGEDINEPADWFTGDDIGLFGGVEYFTPIEGLSLKLDYGTDEYTAEQSAFGFDAPAPWSAGLSYAPVGWINAGLAIQGTDKIMGRLTVQTNPARWPAQDREYKPPTPFYSLHGPEPELERIETRPQDNMLIDNIAIIENRAQADLHLSTFGNTPQQIGRAARSISPHTGPNVQALEFQLISLGLRGPNIHFIRADFENAANIEHQGSPQEIWTNIEFSNETSKNENKEFKDKKLIQPSLYPQAWLVQDNQFSLAEEDTGILFRSALLAEARAPELLGLMTLGGAFRLNIADNLNRIETMRPRAWLSERSNVDRFAARTFALERLYVTTTHSLSPEIHTAFTAGYLEEMYAGIGGEIIYRPFRSRFALGAELWQTLKRDPATSLNLGLTGQQNLSGHLNAWYDWPGQDVTLYARTGRYLAGDLGITAGLEKNFDNGAQLKSFVTLTNNADIDLFGGETQAFHGVSLTLPLGGIPAIPNGSKMIVRAEPFGRDTGQTLDKPIDLYALTDVFTFDHIAENWENITE